MANPFSGLENIGQSYLAGVQLANQRQAREDAIAQRREEARVRERYYQDLVGQRAEAAKLAAQGREDALAIKFGDSLTYNSDGSINFIESARKLKEAGDRDELLETAGFAEQLGVSIPGFALSEQDRKSARYNRGRAQGIVEKTKSDQQLTRIMASQGVFPPGPEKPIPADLEAVITGQGAPTIFDIMAGAVPTTAAPRIEVPEGMVTGRLGGRDVMMRKPKTEKPARTEYPGEIEIETPEGTMKLKLTADQIAERMSKIGAPAGTANPAVKARFQRDPVTGKLVLAK